MVERTGVPLLNPVLTFLKAPAPSTVPGGGKNEKGIMYSRLEQQRAKLSSSFDGFSKAEAKVPSHAGKVYIIAKMFSDSTAPSWTPGDLFNVSNSCRISAPAYEGYLLEAKVEDFAIVSEKIKKSKNIKDKVDISRVETVKFFDASEIFRGEEVEKTWQLASTRENGGLFTIWLLPFFDKASRKSVEQELISLYRDKVITFGDSEFTNIFGSRESVTSDGRGDIDPILLEILNAYIKSGRASFTAGVSTFENLSRIAASGTSYRIEPVSRMRTVSSIPGAGQEPTPPSNNRNTMPTIVIVDGGRSAKSYDGLEVDSFVPLIKDVDSDKQHGNKITSLICHGYAWNNNLTLPELDCSFITAQAISKKGTPKEPTPDQFLAYLRDVARLSAGRAKVWNLSFNEIAPSSNLEEVSYLGHKISKLAREFNILPIISAGNISLGNSDILCPPADCEAALTVGGRLADKNGAPSRSCPNSLRGPAAGGMKKPDLSWFSTLRMLGGSAQTGTSYSTTLVSSLAAHTFLNLKNPTPDLVRALLLNSAELAKHDNALGWGTPWEEDSLPWVCDKGTVTLAWTSMLRPGFAYYWEDIPLPHEMISDGKLSGSASLTAVLKPIVSESGGDNYFSTRLQVSLQAKSKANKNISLLGSMKESSLKEADARSELSKWSPVRRHWASFKRKEIQGVSARVYARIYTRDLYQFEISSHHELPEQEVAFVLTFKSEDVNSDIYNAMAQRLGATVESAVVEQDIHISLNEDVSL